MGEFEVFYKAKEKEKLAKQVAERVLQYNIRVDVILSLIQKMLLKAEEWGVEDCDWLIQDGKDKVAWKVHEGIWFHPIYLMPDLSCSLAFGVNLNKENESIVFKSVIYLKHIDPNNILAQPGCKSDYDDVRAEPENVIERQPNFETIQALCTEMIKIANERFRVPTKELRKLAYYHNLILI
jgi:hypothetical protein